MDVTLSERAADSSLCPGYDVTGWGADSEYSSELHRREAGDRVAGVDDYTEGRDAIAGRERSVCDAKRQRFGRDLEIVTEANACVFAAERREGRPVKGERRHSGII